MASRWSDIFEREPERELELGPSHEPGPQPDSWFADKVEDVPPMQATQAPQPEAEFQDGIEVEEEDEPAPKRKKKTSVAAREWERLSCRVVLRSCASAATRRIAWKRVPHGD